MKLRAEEAAQLVGGDLEGDGDLVLTGLAGIREAKPGELSFVANSRYAAAVAATRAGAVIVSRDWNRPAPCALIRVDQPDRAFARIAERFAPPPIVPPPGVHPAAVVAPDAELGEGASIGPHCVLEPGCRVGAGSVLFAGVYVGHESRIGEQTRLYPLVSIRERCRIGSRCIVHNGAVIGSDGFGYTVEEDGSRSKIPQIGIVVIGDDVEIGANVTIDRARFGQTYVGHGVKIDNLVQIAHNVTIGDHAVIVAQVGISGSTSIGARAVLAGQAGVAGHLHVGDGAIVGAQSGVTKSIPPGAFVSGYPAAPHEKATRIHALTMRLPEWRERLARLEERLGRLEALKRAGPSG